MLDQQTILLTASLSQFLTTKDNFTNKAVEQSLWQRVWFAGYALLPQGDHQRKRWQWQRKEDSAEEDSGESRGLGVGGATNRMPQRGEQKS